MHTLAFLLAVAAQAVMIPPHSVGPIELACGVAETINTLIKEDKLQYFAPTSPAEKNDEDQETIALLKMAWKGVDMSPSILARGVRDLGPKHQDGHVQNCLAAVPGTLPVASRCLGPSLLDFPSTPRTCGTQLFQQ